MPDLTTEEVYSTPQINIPPTFPFILKQYAKAAIRTQPYDLLKWSAAYFRALARGETPPTKDRLEYPPPDTPSGLSPGYLKVLVKQVGKEGTVTVEQLMERWNGICLGEESLHEMLSVGNFGDTLDWLHFVAVAAGFLTNSLTQTMVLLCNLLTDEEDGGSASIPLQTFIKLYSFLATLDCGSLNENEDEDHREYVFQKDPPPLKRNYLESSLTDSSIFDTCFSSSNADQLFVASTSPFVSPRLSETMVSSSISSPLHSPQGTPLSLENASSSTLTPETVQILVGGDKIAEGGSEEAPLETYYEGKIKESALSSQENIEEDPNKVFETSQEESISQTADSKQVTGTEEKADFENESTIAGATSKAQCSLSKGGNGHGDVNESMSAVSPTCNSSTAEKVNPERSNHFREVPGIGSVVDAIQIQAVIEYMEGVALTQDGMVKTSNIRHFLCPPLENVPASQKTKV